MVSHLFFRYSFVLSYHLCLYQSLLSICVDRFLVLVSRVHALDPLAMPGQWPCGLLLNYLT